MDWKPTYIFFNIIKSGQRMDIGNARFSILFLNIRENDNEVSQVTYIRNGIEYFFTFFWVYELIHG